MKISASIPKDLPPSATSADSRRSIPSVEKILQSLGPSVLPRAVTLAIIRHELDAMRSGDEVLTEEKVFARIRSALNRFNSARLQPVINGTGILIHTNLGRAPLAPEAVATIASVASHYNNLEYDLNTGARGSRAFALEHNLALLCGAEAATVVNNCAAALVLVLRHFTKHKPEVVISRGELVQIGGGFRIPEILEASGATLREIGTTNQTSIEDYARALRPETGLILKVHRSNFHMEGFVDSPDSEAIAELAHRHGIPFVEDLGSGAMINTESIDGLEHEPTPAEVLRHGAELLTFSGDKLFGGPQAGIITGRSEHITALKREPFFRALRCDKLVLAGLEATVELYLNGSQNIPVLAMLRIPLEELYTRAEKIVQQLANLPLVAKIGTGEGRVGGGTLPRCAVPSVTIELEPGKISVSEFATQLRAASPPVLGCIADGVYKIDLRTVFQEQDAQLVAGIKAALNWGLESPQNPQAGKPALRAMETFASERHP